MVSAGLFAAAAVVVKVEPRVEPVRVQETGGVTLLWEDDSAARDLLSAADVDSPFPDRWEPRPSAVLGQELKRLGAALDVRGAYRPRLRPRLQAAVPPALPGLLGERAPSLPAPVVAAPPANVPGPPDEVFVHTTIDASLVDRWLGKDVPWEGDDGASLLGREASFLLGVTPTGAVEFCLAIDTGGLDSELSQLLANWLRNQEFTPAADAVAGTTWGVVRISFGPKREGEGGTP